MLVSLFLATAAGVIVMRSTWWVFVWTVPAALLFGQIGFIAHEACHNQVLHASRGNYVLSLLLFNLGLGGSRGWWWNKHNAHHAHPNRIGVDPDITGGVIATSRREASEARGMARLVIRRQAVAIWPLLSLGVLQIHVYSGGFLFDRRLRHARWEAALLLAHAAAYLGCLVVVLGLERGLLFALAHRMLLGVYLGGAFLANHLGMPMLEGDESMDFLRRQVLTARNLRAGPLSDWLFGDLACQIEHHLFPTMPRYNLRPASHLVRTFCEDRGIPYHETGVLAAFGEVRRHLASVVAPPRPQPA